MASDTSRAAQYRAARSGCGFWRQPERPGIELVGADRARLLNGLVTCDVAALAPGEGAQGFFTDIKGHVLAEVVVRVESDTLGLQVASSATERIAAHIERYIIADRVEVHRSVPLATVTFFGPDAARRVSCVRGLETPPVEPWSHRRIEVGTEWIEVVADAHYGIPAISLAATQAVIEQVLTEVGSAATGEPPMEIQRQVVETIRIEEGQPAFECDYDTGNLPQETGLETAVDYDKGCYLGQEVVARLHFRGQVARRVTPLRGVGERLPEVGSTLIFEGREAGALTSVTRRPDSDEIAALAMLQRRAWDPGNRLEIADGESLRVVATS